MLKTIIRIPLKFFHLISTLFYFFPKYYYEDKKVQGRIIKRKSVVILNHKKPIDMFLILHVFWFRYLRVLVGETMFNKNFFFRGFLKLFGAIEVDRINYDMRFINESINILNKNKGTIVAFPESRLPVSDEMLPFKPSAIYIAIQTNSPIIPVYHNGNYGVFKRVKVVIGKPIYYNDVSKNPTNEELEKLSVELRKKVIELSKLIR